MRPDPRLDPDLLARQSGVVTRVQLQGSRITDAAVTAHLRAGRWQRLHAGVYLTSPIPATFEQRVWGGVLSAGPGAVASHATAAALWGMQPEPDGPVTVSVLVPHQPRRSPGLVVRRRRRLVSAPDLDPVRTPVIDTVLDLAADCHEPGDVVTLLTRQVDRRGVTAGAVRAALEERPMQRWRSLLIELTDAVGDGVRSALELRYWRDVELAHGLPRPTRQRSRRQGGRWYVNDVDYDTWMLTVELDGRLNHAGSGRAFRDMARDNAAILDGRHTLRFGWVAVVGAPCQVAAQVATALHRAGWRGLPRRCGAACTLE